MWLLGIKVDFNSYLFRPQVPQPVPVRYVYMPTGTQPQFVTINGQQLQVGGGLQGQQLVAVQGGPGQPQQYSSLPPGC